jgi:DNA-binding transcriptional LysR family regulator
MDLDLRQLRALIAVVDQGSFTDAAIALGTSQASVSRAVAALETALGARVLRRNTRQVSPTVVGARAVRHARRVLEEVAALRRSIVSPDGLLRIGYAWPRSAGTPPRCSRSGPTSTPGRNWSSSTPGAAPQV